jgi:adenylate cyclase
VGAEAGGRRLAAILAADVVGYSRLIGADEPGTLAKLAALRSSVIDPQMAEYGGRVFKTTGDGLLAEFASGVQAVQCAIAIQQVMREHQGIELRIGLHSADVTVQPDGDLLGDGVNVAARLEGLAEPGGICISGRVREDAAGKIALDIEDIGTPELKNIAQQHRVFRVRLGAPEQPVLALPDKPSIAVLPFANLSGDKEQEYFADGVADDILTALSRDRWLFVIARNSSFSYRDRSLDMRQIGRELGVRYLLEGSVRRAGGRLRLTAQLIDAATGSHIWAEKYEGPAEAVFDLQDSISQAVASILSPTIRNAEIERMRRKRPESLDAYDLALRAISLTIDFSHEALESALQLAREALRRDPDYALALTLAALSIYNLYVVGRVTFSDAATEALDLADRALRADRSDPNVLNVAGLVYATFEHDVLKGIALCEEALALNPNEAWCLVNSALLLLEIGDCRRAIEQTELAMRLSPRDPFAFLMFHRLALGHLLEGDLETAYRHAVRCVQLKPDLFYGSAIVASTAALLGKEVEATAATARLLTLYPGYTIAEQKERRSTLAGEKWGIFFEGLRRAGVPE